MKHINIAILFYFILFLSFSSSLYSQKIKLIETGDFYAYAAQDIKNEPKQVKDTTFSNKKLDLSKPEIEYVPLNQFLLAGSRRYTITGDTPQLTTKIKPVPAIVLGTIFTGIFIVQHEMQQNTIWKRVGPFQVAEDGKFSAFLDKCGHIYGSYMPSYLFGEILMESGFSWDDATIIGGTMGMAYTTYVEVLDGFSLDFGFSPSDWFADVAGASFYIAQHYVPVLQNFTPKFMYVNPPWHGENNRKDADAFIDNYSSQTFYLSVNVHNLLPEDAKKFWPSWLELSFGYAVYSISQGSTKNNAELIYNDPNYGMVYGNRKLLISLDYNLIKLLPEGPGFWNWVRQGLNYFKLPSPTLEIGRDNTKFFFFYPFLLRIGEVRF